MPSSSGGGGSGGGAPPASAYERRLLEVHEKTLQNWRALLTQPGVKADALALGPAFAEALAECGDWRGAVLAGDASVAQLVLPRLFPRLAPLVAEGYLEGLLASVADAVVTNTQAELAVIARERSLPERFRELERRVEAARRGNGGGGGGGGGGGAAADAGATGGDDDAGRAVMPEDEMRGVAMGAKLGYEQQLRAQLEALRRENAALEAEVTAADSRARAVKLGVEAKVKALSALSELGAIAGGQGGSEEE